MVYHIDCAKLKGPSHAQMPVEVFQFEDCLYPYFVANPLADMCFTLGKYRTIDLLSFIFSALLLKQLMTPVNTLGWWCEEYILDVSISVCTLSAHTSEDTSISPL